MTPEGYEREHERETIALAEKGDTDAAREALDLIVHGLASGNLSKALSDYLVERLLRVLDRGQRADEALGLRDRRRGRKPGTVTHDASALAAAFALLIRRGYKAESAKEVLRQETGADKNTIDRARNSHSGYEDPACFDERDLVSFLGHLAPKMDRILVGAKRER